MNLLLFNLATDEAHVTLAFGLRWIKELAGHFDHIDVVTMYEGQHRLPNNIKVWSVGRERGYPRFLRIFRFYWIVLQIFRYRRIDVVFTHMIHVFVLLFWPVAKLTGVKNLLWYAHGAIPLGLRFSHLLVDKVVSSTPEGFRLPSRKVVFTGQGVDTFLYRRAGGRGQGKFRLITVGRISPSKHLGLLLDAIEAWQNRCDVDWELTIVGASTSPTEQFYEKQLVDRITKMSDRDRIHLRGRLDPENIAQLLSDADVFINVSSTGSLDKAIVEAMASGCVVLSSNAAFCQIARESGHPECCVAAEAGALAEAINRVVQQSAVEKQALGETLRIIAVRDHSLGQLINRVCLELRLLAAKRRIST